MPQDFRRSRSNDRNRSTVFAPRLQWFGRCIRVARGRLGERHEVVQARRQGTHF
jgi:hypothetical protein